MSTEKNLNSPTYIYYYQLDAWWARKNFYEDGEPISYPAKQMSVEIPDNDGMQGFWLNVELEFTKGSGAKYWVPPGKIDYVEKVPNRR